MSWPGVVCNCLFIIIRSESIIAFVPFTIRQKEPLLLCQHWIYCRDYTFQKYTHANGAYTVLYNNHKIQIYCMKQNTLHEVSTFGVTLGCWLFKMTWGSFLSPSPSILSHSFSTSNLETEWNIYLGKEGSLSKWCSRTIWDIYCRSFWWKLI